MTLWKKYYKCGICFSSLKTFEDRLDDYSLNNREDYNWEFTDRKMLGDNFIILKEVASFCLNIRKLNVNAYVMTTLKHMCSSQF